MNSHRLVIDPEDRSLYYINDKTGLKDGKYLQFFDRATINHIERFREFDIYSVINSFGHDIRMEGDYLKGQRVGIWLEYYENGKIESRMEYRRGQLNGVYTTYYPDGNIHRSGYYRDDLREGVWTTYWDNEQVMSSGMYENDERIGKWDFYDSLGLLITSIKYPSLEVIEYTGYYPLELETEIHRDD